mgnify:CR=1 FL=1
MANARFSIAPAYYTGSEVTPEVTVTHSGKTLVKDRDFTVTYHNNIEPSSYYNSPWVGIDGIGNYQGYVTKSFTINRADISSCTVTLSDESLTYTGSSLHPTATVKSGDKELTLNQDYYVSYRNNWDAGTASAILTGTGNYTGSVTKDFTIKPLDISRYSASLSQYSYTSDGTEKCPDVTVTYGDKTLATGTDFTVSYKDNVKEGTATVTITGAGNYTGIINTTFTITAAPGKDDSDAGKDNPGKDDSGKDDSGKDDSGKDDSGKDDSGKDNSGKDNSGKDDSDKGNQNSSMKKAKTLTVKGSATRATLKKLVSKKKYYVRIRTYKVVSGKKYYSKWSSKKSVKLDNVKCQAASLNDAAWHFFINLPNLPEDSIFSV